MAATLDLVVVNPSFNKRVYQGLSDEFAAIEPPVWAGLLASFARNRGYRVVIIDAQAENLSPQETAERIESLSPLYRCARAALEHPPRHRTGRLLVDFSVTRPGHH